MGGFPGHGLLNVGCGGACVDASKHIGAGQLQEHHSRPRDASRFPLGDARRSDAKKMRDRAWAAERSNDLCCWGIHSLSILAQANLNTSPG